MTILGKVGKPCTPKQRQPSLLSWCRFLLLLASRAVAPSLSGNQHGNQPWLPATNLGRAAQPPGTHWIDPGYLSAYQRAYQEARARTQFCLRVELKVHTSKFNGDGILIDTVPALREPRDSGKHLPARRGRKVATTATNPPRCRRFLVADPCNDPTGLPPTIGARPARPNPQWAASCG
jgi:hypothetical protein